MESHGGKVGKNEGVGSLHEAEEEFSVGGHGLCDDWNWDKCRPAGLCSQQLPRKLKNPNQTKQRREGSRVLPTVTDGGSQRCLNFRVALVHKALSASQVCAKGIILDSEPIQSGMLHKHTGESIGLRDARGVYVFDGWLSVAATAGRKRTKDLSMAPYESEADAAPAGFLGQSEPSVRPASHLQVEDQPVHPEDTVGWWWRRGSQSCSGAGVSNKADTQIN